MQDADVVVVGAGTTGSMALWQLSKRPGLRVVGVEQFGRVHTHGSFSGESRLFRTAAKEGALYVPLLREARRMWRELEAESGREIYLECGALSIGPAGSAPMETTARVVDEHGLAARTFGTDQLRAAYPQFAVHEGDVGILDLHAGGLRPEVAVAAALDRAEAQGARLLFNTGVLDIERHADHTLVRTTQGTLRTRKVVVSAGSWTRTLLPELADLVTVKPLGLTWFMPRRIEDFLPERFPVFMRDVHLRDGRVVHFFGAPSLDGYSIKVSPSLLWEDVEHPGQVPGGFTREELVLLGQQAQALIPDLNPEPVRTSLHHDGFTADSVPIVELDAAGDCTVVAGLSGNGFKFAPVHGRMLAELVLDGTSALHREAFTVAAHRARRAAAASLDVPAPEQESVLV
ncbi:N-methyl-L-tryptophan oxidase [Kocuria sp. CPCC 205263]|uniref:N-methyl-L-tryptophan oxidase n=1 Tax=Kocuria sp. CPCC 205263 TaxID=3073555 RepID=UPI0034D74026